MRAGLFISIVSNEEEIEERRWRRDGAMVGEDGHT